jgi:hypothetical protein
MGVLTSELFTQGDPATVRKLEDCATGRPNEVLSHFSQGANARGAHISRVQAALRNVQRLDPDLGIPEFEVNGVYDKAFADAVSVYKERRNIRNYANKIDNIIGIKTILSLDADAKRRKEEPPPKPKTDTEERVTFRETGATVVITKEPREPGLGGGKLGKLITIFNVAKNIPADIKHIEQHPYQGGDLDRDSVRKETKAPVQKDHVLLRVHIEKNIVQHQVEVHFGYYEIKVDHTRSYTFTWGPGTPNQQVAVARHVKLMTDRGRVDLDSTDSFFVKQPPNLADP